jgi:hypothetical protein
MDGKPWARLSSPLMIATCGCLGLAYAGARSLPFILAACSLAAVFVQPRVRRLLAIDWAVLLVSSRHAANGVSSAKVVLISSLFYFLVRIVATRPSQHLIAALILAAGGAALAWPAVSQFNGHFHELQGNELSGLVLSGIG